MKLLYSDYTDTEHLRELSEKYKVPGFNFTLIKNGAATETQAYGITNSETMAPMTPSTIFEAASLTKTLFATLIMRLRDWGCSTRHRYGAQKSVPKRAASFLPMGKCWNSGII